jgi:hypothetical protein
MRTENSKETVVTTEQEFLRKASRIAARRHPAV